MKAEAIQPAVGFGASKGQSAINLIVAILRYAFAYPMMMLNGLIVITLYGLSFGLLRRFNAEVVNRFFSRMILMSLGIRFSVEGVRPPRGEYVYMFNHNSYLDMFMFGALGLRSTRIIISEKTKVTWSVTLINWGCGTFFIPLKPKRDERIAFLKMVTTHLKETEDSVICSPEGVHVSKHGIEKFNKGVFHMITAANKPIVPLFFEIPKASNPLQSYFFKSGKVKVHFLPVVETRTWTLEEMEQNRDKIRKIFVDEFNQIFPEEKTQ